MSRKTTSEFNRGVNRTAAFTLAELLMCMAVTGMVFTGILGGYLQSTYHAADSEHASSMLGVAAVQPELTQPAR